MTGFDVSGVRIGGGRPIIIAGPCTVESEEQTLAVARAVKRSGAKILRGGAFKPRTSPYSFQGLGEEGLKILSAAKAETGLLVQTEVMDASQIDLVCKHADILQIGTRNMMNYSLLKAIGETRFPVMLKRGFMSKVDEFLLAAEYITKGGNEQLFLCERGIRTFETGTRFTLDLSAVPIIKKMSQLPIVVDPSHATGRADLILPMSLAALAAGADGIMVEVHPQPKKAMCDGLQSLTIETFGDYMTRIRAMTAFLLQQNEGN
ncbi:3-deoxy-7-phosphoheptulonate synthase [bacterium]|nr:3-deoxy-7-phosphoheptulonate synthase [bacterium]